VRLWLAAVGRARPGPETDLYQGYAARLQPSLQLREVEEKRRLSPPERKAREAEPLLGAVPGGAMLVALDETGRSMGSREFAIKLGRWRDEGVADLAFLVGGADGHGEAVRSRAGLLLSLGPMTWPHMLVRVLLAEQLWRAQSILAGHPYHRD
jgi:23S rRNA (pseudouridine1915-N3)-methyltransferase